MKTWPLITVFICISLIIRAQEYSSIYHFDAADKKTFSTSCGDIDGDGWKVSKNSCNFYTPLTSIDDSGVDRWIDIKANFSGSDNLDGRDFVWIFYYVNGNAVKTSTITGVFDKTNFVFNDSLLVPSGGSYRFRIAMVCDDADEHWMLSSKNLSISTRAIVGEQVIEKAETATEAKIRIASERGVIKLSWLEEPGTIPNYFKIERSQNGEQFEFAGFVKEYKSTDRITRYSFIDAGAYNPQTWYRIKKVDMNGIEVPIGDSVSIKL